LKKDSVFIEHIWESINKIERYITDVDKEKFVSSSAIQDMIFRRLEIIGEAVKNLSEDFIIYNSEIEWKKISGLRDILIHNYFGIDLDLTWNVIKKDIPDLKNKVSKIRDNFDQKPLI